MSEYTTLSIASLGAATLPKEEKRVIRGRDSNDISDIDGARTTNRYEKYTNKPQFLNSDVPGASSKILSHSRNVPDRSLEIDDIDGTRFFIKDSFFRTKRDVNPLNPTYKLASYAPVEPFQPKFVRDNLYHDDVEGSRTKASRPFLPRDTMSVNDIEGAQVNWKPRNERARLEASPYDNMNTDGVMIRNIRHQDRSNRVVDALNPVYEFDGMIIADDKFSKPRKPKSLISDNNQLKTQDILGATAGWHTFNGREVKNTNFLGDIIGAHADTIKHSIITNRSTHPLVPIYQSLDDGEALMPLNKPLIPSSMVKVSTLTSTHIEKYESEKLHRENPSANPSSHETETFSVSYANKLSSNHQPPFHQATNFEDSKTDLKDKLQLSFPSSLPQQQQQQQQGILTSTFGASGGLVMSGMNSINFSGNNSNRDNSNTSNSNRNSNRENNNNNYNNNNYNSNSNNNSGRKQSFSKNSPSISARNKSQQLEQQSARQAEIEAVRQLK